MNKTQRLRNTAEGFLAGLVEVGFVGPFLWADHQWEGTFYRSWGRWRPAARTSAGLPQFKLGGSADGRTSQARDMLWQIKQTSPFRDFRTQPLTTSPYGLSPQEYLRIHVQGASPAEWMSLSESFLDGMERVQATQADDAPHE